MKTKPILRFAPSPTGNLHIGSARTALFNYLFAKKEAGKLILRIDDTDKERSKKEFEKNIHDGLNWLSLLFDEEFKQSERGDIYKKHTRNLLDSGKIYISEEKEGDRKEVIRFKNPNKVISFNDQIRGNIEFDTSELGDFVVAKDEDTPLYHLASVIDDYEMGVTHIIRGEDHISNTPRQILISESLGAQIPIYAHIPLILAPDRTKLSKRHGALALTEYRDLGYLPEAINNFLALLGWSPQAGKNSTDEEIFSLKELIELFSISAIQKSPAIFNLEKLSWLNRQHLKNLSNEDFLDYVLPLIPENTKKSLTYSEEKLLQILPILIERINTLSELKEMIKEGEIDYFFAKPQISKELLKNTEHLKETRNLLETLPDENFTPEKIKEILWDFATEKGRGEVLWPLRISLTGRKQSPDPFSVASILGKQETLDRIEIASNI